ncbi:MAG: 6,7-dimethyl-8-ribityllumazine synthase [Lysobacteraceae bacterium]|jgi:6,7-dimethyl-8-ribityllumazine synthase|uniref:6,7-dimethyl-8-ribityllumazine synthase n=1 Tax=Silanimonas sp. TaxID=1929290 RepID=UPI0022C3B340|nr:6,7-dimethyl-8-ribityllumazine synthase [Silanimonas sp.]MCZ8115344.1 6,7-dimethyl-8-ribityllumazine synthase [Silanimonas sp.]
MPRFEGDLRPHPSGRYAIVASRWNPKITNVLVDGARKALVDNGVEAERIDVVRVPGAWEIPLAAAAIAQAGGCVAIIALGCVVRGDTRHYEQVADGCSNALMRVQLDFHLPVANGVLAVEAYADAEARAGGAMGNKGEEAALAALEMSDLLKHWQKTTA